MTALWSSALQRLYGRITEQNFEMWIRPIECRRIEGRTITLRAPNPYVRLWFESNYLEVVLAEFRAECHADYVIEFEPDGDDTDDARGDARGGQRDGHDAGREGDPGAGPGHLARDPAGPTGSGVGAPADHASAREQLARAQDAPGGGLAAAVPDAARPRGKPAEAAADHPAQGPASQPPGSSPLNPKYTFETFVAGPSNQLALAASEAAASTYPPKYNPVFICGGVGLGKTHLLHAIGHQFTNSRPGARILYLSGERFMNEYIQAIRNNAMHEFRRRFREGCDVLLIDDVQFLAGKDGTQDEFFHTFNALHDTHRQIVLTADRKPHEISDIADRLRTRFAWGLLADIEPPELEVRVAILRKKAAAESIQLPDDVALYIASAISSNVRELEGALIRLAAYASLSQREITLAFARETLDGSLTRPREHLSSEVIIKAVASYYGLKVSEIKSARRHKSIAGPRAVAMYLARTHTKESYPDLGRAFGGKHHTTVISAVDKIARKLEREAGLRGEVQALENLILR